MALRTLVTLLVPLIGVAYLLYAPDGRLTSKPSSVELALATTPARPAPSVSRSTTTMRPAETGREVRVVERKVTLDAPVEERHVDGLALGERRVIADGRDGLRIVRVRVVTVDGDVTKRTRLSSRMDIWPLPRIVEIGTGVFESDAPTPPAESVDEPQAETEAPAPAPRPEPAPRERTRPQPEPAPKPAPEPEPETTDDQPSNSQSGDASYYDHPEEGMTAAHRTLPFGTVVTVTNLANGKTVNVRINDRGPYIDGRVIDLNDTAFQQIASLDEGVIRVRIEW